MISRADLDDRTREWGVRLEVVEKDYVIGWLLWGIGSDPVLRDAWVFKGGTCLKKCYIETYRFSEDIDFTVMPSGPVEPDAVLPLLERVLMRVTDASGIDFGVRPATLRARPGSEASEGRVYYRGPLNMPGAAKVKLDLSRAESVVRPTVLQSISHVFPDVLPPAASIRCYGFEELFAEKIRAMAERCRPRDLYDIVNLYRRHDLRQHGDLVAEVLIEKCAAKAIPVPVMATIDASPFRDQLVSEWASMLAHQLPALPPIEQYWAELPGLFQWLAGESEAEVATTIAVGANEDAGWSPPSTVWVWGQVAPLEPVRFAASNRLCVELGYQGTLRTVEPYSLRRTRDGFLLLYAVKLDGGELRSYRVDRIQSVRVTTTPFRPRFAVEIGTSTALTASFSARGHSTAIRASSRSTKQYVLECPSCHRRFAHDSAGTGLRRHKDGHGGWCRGRSGRMVRG